MRCCHCSPPSGLPWRMALGTAPRMRRGLRCVDETQFQNRSELRKGDRHILLRRLRKKSQSPAILLGVLQVQHNSQTIFDSGQRRA
jgi:hypothetical protein